MSMTDEPTAGYTVAAANVTARDVLEALTAGHERVFYREAIARDGLDAVAAGELRDLIEGRHLFATEDEAEAEADDLIARDEFAGPLVLAITADDIRDHLIRAGWTEPEPRHLFDPEA